MSFTLSHAEAAQSLGKHRFGRRKTPLERVEARHDRHEGPLLLTEAIADRPSGHGDPSAGSDLFDGGAKQFGKLGHLNRRQQPLVFDDADPVLVRQPKQRADIRKRQPALFQAVGKPDPVKKQRHRLTRRTRLRGLDWLAIGGAVLVFMLAL